MTNKTKIPAMICLTADEMERKFIAHDALVEALECAQRCMDAKHHDAVTGEPVTESAKFVDAALAKAKAGAA